ncbi:MAG: hypothetical protein AAGJ40_17050 [Planctomycetota bacterium]
MRVDFRLGLILTMMVAGTSACCSRALGQFEWSVNGGAWAAFLPEYEVGHVVSTGDNLLSADQSGVGGSVQFHSFYHFAPTRTMAEFRATIAGADFSRDDYSAVGTAVWSPAGSLPDGTTVAAGDGEDYYVSVRGRTMYNDVLVGLRDKFDLSDYGLGLITLGLGFSHMQFDTTFDSVLSVNSGVTAYDGVESLDTSYIGAEIVGSITRELLGHNVLLDSSLGIYDMNADYVADFDSTGTTPAADVDYTNDLSEVAYTFSLTLMTECLYGDSLIRPSTGFKYISSMPGITRGDGSPANLLRDDDALTFTAGLEFVF